MPRPTKRQPTQANVDVKEITEKMSLLNNGEGSSKASNDGEPAQGQSTASTAAGAERNEGGSRQGKFADKHNSNRMEVLITTLRDDQVFANVIKTAARHLGKNKNGAEIFMTELERDRNNSEYRIGYYPYPKTGNPKVPGTELAFGLILWGRKSDFDGEYLADRMITLMGAIHDTMDSRYDWRPTMINLSRPHVKYHICECCNGPAFNGPHVDPKIRARSLPPRKLKETAYDTVSWRCD
ncbi:hypothetical protein BDZ88DRAFT_451474 [Geranomyces variabilis]|nr:hypothetical protein BDZ88DRAFT_451474 [Geranomyces variabilis]KAJ3141293.1 hypothetical protein HDU90_007320 [Geranomyces variabilis]